MAIGIYTQFLRKWQERRNREQESDKPQASSYKKELRGNVQDSLWLAAIHDYLNIAPYSFLVLRRSPLDLVSLFLFPVSYSHGSLIRRTEVRRYLKENLNIVS